MRASRFTAVRTEPQGRCAGGRARAVHGCAATHEHRGRPVATVEEDHRPFRASRRAEITEESEPRHRTSSALAGRHGRGGRETRLSLAGPRCSSCRVVVGSPSPPLHPCLVIEESAVNRHAGLAEEFDEVGITPGDPGDAPLDCYPPAPGGVGGCTTIGVESIRRTVLRTGRSRARGLRWGRCAVRVTGHINSDARPRRDRCRGTACPGARLTAAASGRPRRTPHAPCPPSGFACGYSSRDRLIA